MQGFKNKQLNTIFQNNAFNMIKSILEISCITMLEDYKNPPDHLDNHEEKIRNCLLENYLNNDEFRHYNNFNQFAFIPEVPETYNQITHTYLGRLDIKVINQDYFSKTKAYYTIECKRLDGSLNLNKKYINEGVARFVLGEPDDPKYPSYYKKNIILGFVVCSSLDIIKNTEQINIIHKSSLDSYIESDLYSIATNNSYHWYCSQYNYVGIDKKSLELNHLFFDFSIIIKK